MKRVFSVLVAFVFIFLIYKLYFIEEKQAELEVVQDKLNPKQEVLSEKKVDLNKLKKTEGELESEETKLASLIKKEVVFNMVKEKPLIGQASREKKSFYSETPPISKNPNTYKVAENIPNSEDLKLDIKQEKLKPKQEKLSDEKVDLNKLKKTESDLESEEVKLASLIKNKPVIAKKEVIVKATKESLPIKQSSVEKKSFYSDTPPVDEKPDIYKVATNTPSLEVIESDLVAEEKKLLLEINKTKANVEEVKIENKKAYVELNTPIIKAEKKNKKKEIKLLKTKLVNSEKKKVAKRKYVRNEFRDPDFFSNSFNNEIFENDMADMLKVKIASAKAALRAGPGINYPRIKVLLKDSSLKLLQQFERWTKVKDESGIESWVDNQDIVHD